MMTISQLCLIFIFSFVLGAESQTPATPTPGAENLPPDSPTVTPDGTPGYLDSVTDPTTMLIETILMTDENITTAPPPNGTEISTSAAPSALNCTPTCGANETCSDVGGVSTCVCIEGYFRADENSTCKALNCTPTCGANETCSDVGGVSTCVCIEGYIRADESSACEVKTCDNIECGFQGECIGNSTVFFECNCNLNFSFKEGDICIDKTCGNSNVCSGPGDTCEDHYISFMCFCGENRMHNEDQSDCIDKTCENSDSCSNPEDKCRDHAFGFWCDCGVDRIPVNGETDCIDKTCDNSCKEDTEQCSDVSGYNCTCIEGYSRPWDGASCQKDEPPTPVNPETLMTTETPTSIEILNDTGTPLTTETPTMTDNYLGSTGITTEPSTAATSTKSSKTTQSKKTSGPTEPTTPGESTKSPSTPDRKDAAGGHNYTGALVGLFIFLVVTCLVFVAVYVVRRRKLRNNYGRLDEDNEGDSGWSAFSKNPIYRGDRDYQLL